MVNEKQRNTFYDRGILDILKKRISLLIDVGI